MGEKSKIGRPRRINSVRHLEELWEEYEEFCDNQMIMTHDFSSKNSEFVSKELRRSITYTIEGFCVYIKMARSVFYATYVNDKRYQGVVSRMREESEFDKRIFAKMVKAVGVA